jgi:hypothetical protein
MKNKKTYVLEKHVNEKIKVNDLVALIDGSGFTEFEFVNYTEDLYIITAYPKITNSNLILKELEFLVVETNVETNVCVGHIAAYIQDIVISFNGVKFRTCSSFVKKV